MSCVQVGASTRTEFTSQSRILSSQNKFNLQLVLLVRSKTALLEGLEVDQYMLGILVYIQK